MSKKEILYLTQFVIYGLVILAFIIGCFWYYVQAKKDFNNGVCPQCKKPLVHFDDSQGGKGWYCRDCKYFIKENYFKR